MNEKYDINKLSEEERIELSKLIKKYKYELQNQDSLNNIFYENYYTKMYSNSQTIERIKELLEKAKVNKDDDN